MSMTASDATVHIFKHYQSYALLQAFLAGVADIVFDEIEATYGTTTDTFLLKASNVLVGTFVVTYTTTVRDIVTNSQYTAA